MFLPAVYYFVGMSKLDEVTRNKFIEEFEVERNRKEITNFFTRFQEEADQRYQAQITAILGAKSYKDMAPKFMELFKSIVEAKDWKSLTFYCDDVDPAFPAFFGTQILEKELKDICKLSTTSISVMERLVGHKGCNSKDFFKGQERSDIVDFDILGLNAVDLANYGFFSSAQMKDPPNDFKSCHLYLSQSLINLDSPVSIDIYLKFYWNLGKSRNYYMAYKANLLALPNSSLKPYLQCLYARSSTLAASCLGAAYTQYWSSDSITRYARTLADNSCIVRYAYQSDNIPMTLACLFTTSIPVACFEALSPIVMFFGSALVVYYQSEKIIFADPKTANTNFIYNKACQLGKEAIAMFAIFFFTNLTYNSLATWYVSIFNAPPIASFYEVSARHPLQIFTAVATYGPLVVSALAIADKYINECKNAYMIPKLIKAGEEDLWSGISQAVA